MMCESLGIRVSEIYGHPENDGRYQELMDYILERDIEENYDTED